MHRVLRPDGSMTQSSFLRWVSAAAYLAFAIGAGLLLWSPELQNIYELSGEVMAWFMLVGAVLSMLGAASRRWVGEFIGLPLLSVGVSVLGFETWLTSHTSYPLLAAGNLALLLGLALVMLVRWRIIIAVFRFVHEIALVEKRRREQGL